MLEFAVVLSFFAFGALLIYAPAIYRYLRFKQSEKEFQYQLSLLTPEYFEKHMILETRPLGLGEEPNGTVSFEQAHKNQEFAMNSVINFMDEICE